MNNGQRWAVLLGFTLVAVGFTQAVGYVGGTFDSLPIACGRAFDDPTESTAIPGEDDDDFGEDPRAVAWCRNALNTRRTLVFSLAGAGATLGLLGYLVFNNVADSP